ncbi:hypothetical protein K438DRAFT_2076139 [Mycena galopus ATCC 62051]|nr:hypothetical protein K438DRAFT_2076139 [Mycena galopus ATCC 62051]
MSTTFHLNTDINALRPPSSKRRLASDEEVKSDAPPKKQKVSRAFRTTPEERKAILDCNQNISEVELHRVRCKACKFWVKLHSKTQYKLENWTQHEARCSLITGKRRKKGAASITSFFGQSKSAPQLNEAEPSSSKPRTVEMSDTDSDSEPMKLPNLSEINRLQTPSIASIFSPGLIKNPPPKPVIYKIPKSCTYLEGDQYREYIERTETRSMGGVSVTLRARLIRQVLPYKKFEPLKSETTMTSPAIHQSLVVVPKNGNDRLPSAEWTAAEIAKVDEALRGFARWEVDFGKRVIRSTRCEGLTTNDDGICAACQKLAKDESLVHAINVKNREADLPLEEQHQILLNRAKYSNGYLAAVEGRKLKRLLEDPVTFKALKTLEKGQTTECFVQLYEAAMNGKLKSFETVREMCTVVAEVIKRQDNNTMSGIRYPAHYLNFAILMRSYGGNSARQFGILRGEIPLPSMRHVRTLVANSEDTLTNPYLIFENMARVKRLADSVNYTGPIAVAGDCTKVRKHLTFSTDFGGHILGSVWELKDCIADDPEDIERVMNKITKEKAEASQLAIPHIPPLAVALIATDGKDDAQKIVALQIKLLKMAAELSLPVVSFAADGAASELAAQSFMDSMQTPFPPITYNYPLYGISLKAPVFATGPLVSTQDAGHAKKTARNQPQHGTKTGSLGADVVVNRTLVSLYETGESGLLASDVKNVDKQDDGPARHLFHFKALQACTVGEGDNIKIRDGMGGLFVYLFVLVSHALSFIGTGVLFDAWLNRTMTVANRVLAVLRARFFLHFWRAHVVYMSSQYPDLYSTARSFISAPSFHIFNRLCDSLLLLVIVYARRYPNEPFCPWLLGTEFVEHFFGLARMMLPNFTWAEFIKLVQHVMVRQKILLSGSFKETRERKARVGYVLDVDPTPLTAEDRKLAQVNITDEQMNSLVEMAFHEATLICTQILHIPAPRPKPHKPLILTPLGVPSPKVVSSNQTSESDSEFDDDESDFEEEELPFPLPDGPEETQMIASATFDAARYSALCDDYEDAVKELDAISTPVVFAPATPPLVSSGPTVPEPPVRSELINAAGKLSISKMLHARLHWQAGTTTRSEKVSQIDSKYALSRIARANSHGDDDTAPEKMTLQEGSNVARVLQQQNATIQENQPKKSRELRWRNMARTVQSLVDAHVLPNIVAKNVHSLNPLALGHWVAVWNGVRFYIGEILDVYKRGANSRYGSVPSADSISGVSFLSLRVYLPLTMVAIAAPQLPDEEEEDESDEETPDEDLVAPLFSCHHQNLRIRLYTHAKIDHLIFNLAPNSNTACSIGVDGTHQAGEGVASSDKADIEAGQI